MKSSIIKEDIHHLLEALKGYEHYFQNKRFLITGAGGFLGKYMVYLLGAMNKTVLKDKCQAILLDNFVTGFEEVIETDRNLTFQKHNVIEPLSIEGNIDYIIHAAGIASPVYYTQYPIETMDVGTIGTRNMLELAKAKSVDSFIFMSSSEVYGDPDPQFVPTKEDYRGNVSMLGSRACYDESKRFGETQSGAFYEVHKVPVKIIRPFNVYGPGIRPDDFRVLPNFIEHALRGEDLPVHGAGNNTRSFCYITDCIEAIFKVLFSDSNGEAFNVGNPKPEISVLDLAKEVSSLMPESINVKQVEPPHDVYAANDPKRRCPDISKLQEHITFEPKVDLRSGLKRTIEWFTEERKDFKTKSFDWSKTLKGAKTV